MKLNYHFFLWGIVFLTSFQLFTMQTIFDLQKSMEVCKYFLNRSLSSPCYADYEKIKSSAKEAGQAIKELQGALKPLLKKRYELREGHTVVPLVYAILSHAHGQLLLVDDSVDSVSSNELDATLDHGKVLALGAHARSACILERLFGIINKNHSAFIQSNQTLTNVLSLASWGEKYNLLISMAKHYQQWFNCSGHESMVTQNPNRVLSNTSVLGNNMTSSTQTFASTEDTKEKEHAGDPFSSIPGKTFATTSMTNSRQTPSPDPREYQTVAPRAVTPGEAYIISCMPNSRRMPSPDFRRSSSSMSGSASTTTSMPNSRRMPSPDFRRHLDTSGSSISSSSMPGLASITTSMIKPRRMTSPDPREHQLNASSSSTSEIASLTRSITNSQQVSSQELSESQIKKTSAICAYLHDAYMQLLIALGDVNLLLDDLAKRLPLEAYAPQYATDGTLSGVSVGGNSRVNISNERHTMTSSTKNQKPLDLGNELSMISRGIRDIVKLLTFKLSQGMQSSVSKTSDLGLKQSANNSNTIKTFIWDYKGNATPSNVLKQEKKIDEKSKIAETIDMKNLISDIRNLLQKLEPVVDVLAEGFKKPQLSVHNMDEALIPLWLNLMQKYQRMFVDTDENVINLLACKYARAESYGTEEFRQLLETAAIQWEEQSIALQNQYEKEQKESATE